MGIDAPFGLLFAACQSSSSTRLRRPRFGQVCVVNVGEAALCEDKAVFRLAGGWRRDKHVVAGEVMLRRLANENFRKIPPKAFPNSLMRGIMKFIDYRPLEELKVLQEVDYAGTKN